MTILLAFVINFLWAMQLASAKSLLMMQDGKMVASEEYIGTIIACCNEKLIASRERMERLRIALVGGVERKVPRCICEHF